MLALSLFLALQQIPGATATAADSAFTRDALLRGLAELTAAGATSDQRYVEQLQIWGLVDEAWRLAEQGARNAPAGTLADVIAANVLVELYRAGDAAGAERRLEELPEPLRDRIRGVLAMRFWEADSALALRLAGEIRGGLERARVLAHRAKYQSRDSAAARELLRRAIELARSDTAQAAAYHAKMWLYDLRGMGGAVTVGDLVAATAAELGNLRLARMQVVDVLIWKGDRAAAMPLLDTLFATAPHDTTQGSYYHRAVLHEMRGTRADSLRARALRDSAMARRPPTEQERAALRERRRWEAAHILHDLIRRGMVDSLAVAVQGVLEHERAAETLATAAEAARGILLWRRSYGPGLLPDSLIRWAERVHAGLWKATEGLGREARDSARVPMIGLLAEVDPERALRLARDSISVAPFRDRAMAAALARLAHTDADRAAREAGALEDFEARNVAYLELTARAVADGRLAAAADLAGRTAGGEPRVRAQLAVASAESKSGREAAARDRLARTLHLLDPTWRCEGLCVIPSPEGSPPAPPRGMNRHLILEFVLLALRADLRDELVDWAASQPDAGGRAAAWIVIAEAMSELRLGRFVVYPVH